MDEQHSHSRLFMLCVQFILFQKKNGFWKPTCSENGRQNHATNVILRVILNTKMKLQIPAREVNNMAVTGKSLLRLDLWSDKCDPYVPAWKTICGCIFYWVKRCWNTALNNQAKARKLMSFDYILKEKTSKYLH